MDPFDLREWEGFALAGGNLSFPAIVDQITIDSRRVDSPHALFVALKGEREDGHAYVQQAISSGAKFILVSHNWNPPFSVAHATLLRVQDPLYAFQSIAKAYRLSLNIPIIGITGSFGKTMVKDLLHLFLGTQKKTAASPESFNSQIGVPLSLLTLSAQHEVGIIEAAISQKEEMRVLVDLIQPHDTILTPLGNKHLTTLHDLSTLTNETMQLIQATPLDGWSLLPGQKDVQRQTTCLACPYFFWDHSYPQLPHATPLFSDSTFKYHIAFPDQTSYQGDIHMGHAYFLNLLNMSIKAAWLMGITSANIRSVLEHYQPEPMRTEMWKSSLGSTLINETYCSDPQSIDQALQHFETVSEENRKVFVFSGIRHPDQATPTDYRRIGKSLAKHHLQHLILVGSQPFQPLIEEMRELSKKTEILRFETQEDTLTYLYQYLQKQDVVIFKGEHKLNLDRLTEIFNDGLANNQCTINLAAIAANLTHIRAHLPPKTRIMAIVKALAYGTDDVRIAKFLERSGIDLLGVSYVDEGVTLRRAGVKQGIFSINVAPYEVNKVVKWDLEVGVQDKHLITKLASEATLKEKRIKVHLHVNTGMGRFGCRPEEALELARHILSFPSLELEGVMTHFACAENPQEDAFTLEQIHCFDAVIQELENKEISLKWKHAANSSGALRFHLPQYNMVRIGLAVYGLYASEAVEQALPLRLALSLTSRIVGINTCKKGETISYGRRYQVKSEMQKIAVLPIGYFDGMHRNYSEKAHVLIRGEKAPMVGTICMDYMMVDVTHIPHAEIGDKVLIFGEDEFGDYLSPEALADQGNSIIHELITCLGPRIHRVFIYEEGKQIR